MASLSTPAPAQVITYEGNVFPEQVGWVRLAGGTPQRRLEDGWLTQTFPEEAQDFYRHDIAGGFVGRFFMEWRAMTNYPEPLIDDWQTPAAVAGGGKAGVLYHTVMTESATVLLRDIFIPRVIASVSVGDPHIYRVEVYADEYIWYIDSVVVDRATPEGPYPDPDASITWGARRNGIAAATAVWDYLRLGAIPDDASGDFDSDAAVTLIDQYFVVDCLTKDSPGIFGGPGHDAGPGCRFADFDADSDVDLLDLAEFQNLFTSP